MADSSMSVEAAETDVPSLKEALHSQNHLMQQLSAELEQEREASATAASEALSFILRLQGEKAAERLEANQFKREAEEKIHHANESLALFEELIYGKEIQITSLRYQLEAYKHKLLSKGFTDHDLEELDLSENFPLCEDIRELDEMGSCKSILKGITESCRCLNLEEHLGQNGASCSSKRDRLGDADIEFGTDSGFNGLYCPMIGNENFTHLPDKVRKLHTESEVEDNHSYWEHIEQMDKGVKEPILNKSIDERFNSPWFFANKELQATLGAYSATLKTDSRTCSKHPVVSNESLNGSNVGWGHKVGTGCSPSCSGSEAEDTENLLNSDAHVEMPIKASTSNCAGIHDIYEIPQNPDSDRLHDFHKQATPKKNFDGENGIETPDFVKQKTIDCFSKDEPQSAKKLFPCAQYAKLSAKSSSIKLDGDWTVDPNNGKDTPPVEMKHLIERLQTIEDDTKVIRQETSKDRVEEIMLLKGIREQLQAIESQMTVPNTEANVQQDERFIVSTMEAMLSISL